MSAPSRIRAPHGASPPVARQEWERLAFLHWDCAPRLVQPLLPEGLRPQTADGRAWVGITPFRLRGLRPTGLPAVPGWSTFPEINVRTYVVDAHGREGLWFFSLEVARASVAAAFRIAAGVPYRTARIDLDADEGGLRVHWRRGSATAAATVTASGRAGPPAPGSLDDFLTGRWRAFGVRARRLLRTPIAHEPWPLQAAEATGDWAGLLQAVGLDLGGPPTRVAFSPGVSVRVGLPRVG